MLFLTRWFGVTGSDADRNLSGSSLTSRRSPRESS